MAYKVYLNKAVKRQIAKYIFSCFTLAKEIPNGSSEELNSLHRKIRNNS